MLFRRFKFYLAHSLTLHKNKSSHHDIALESSLIDIGCDPLINMRETEEITRSLRENSSRNEGCQNSSIDHQGKIAFAYGLLLHLDDDNSLTSCNYSDDQTTLTITPQSYRGYE